MKLIRAVIVLAFLLVAFTGQADASCHTHRCWERVRVNHLEQMVEKKIKRVAPIICYGQRSVKPCWVIRQESLTSGFWRAYNPHPCGHGQHAVGLYQLCGWGAPFPVIVSWGPRLWRKYKTLKNELVHHRIAARLSLSNW